MSQRWKIILGSVAGAIVLLALVLYWLTRPLPVLTVATWSGPYGRAQANALFRTFGDARRIDVHIALYDGGLRELHRMLASGQYEWDVMDFELPDAIEACRRGWLEPIDAASLPAGADGTPAAQDFVRNAIGPCWVGSVVYSQVVAYSPRRFGEAHPQTIANFFDLQRFPGPRALRRDGAKFNLVLALLADGVKAQDVYRVLSTPQGVRRALTKLSSIRSSLIWWNNSADAAAMLNDGRAAFATVLNGDVYDAAQHHNDLGVIWDHQLYELDVFGLPRSGPHKDRALDFVRFATGSKPLAGVANWVPYGPARHSSLPFVGRNPELGIAMAPYLPTTKEHFATAFALDDQWWQLNGADIMPLWQSWQASGK